MFTSTCMCSYMYLYVLSAGLWRRGHEKETRVACHWRQRQALRLWQWALYLFLNISASCFSFICNSHILKTQLSRCMCLFQSVESDIRTAQGWATITLTHTWRMKRVRKTQSDIHCPSSARTTTSVSLLCDQLTNNYPSSSLNHFIWSEWRKNRYDVLVLRFPNHSNNPS